MMKALTRLLVPAAFLILVLGLITNWAFDPLTLLIWGVVFAFLAESLTAVAEKVLSPDSLGQTFWAALKSLALFCLFALTAHWLSNFNFISLVVIHAYVMAGATILGTMVYVVSRNRRGPAVAPKPVKNDRIELSWEGTEFLTDREELRKTFGAVEVLTGRKVPDGDSTLIEKKLINHVGAINSWLAEQYKRLEPGGVLLFPYRPLDDVEARIRKGFGKPGFLLYFLVMRVIPKIPYLGPALTLLSAGRWRSISRTEVWGRLSYSGFDAETEWKDETTGYYWVLARKCMQPAKNATPSFYPIIRLNRVGYGGKVIRVYKTRSMYPYSEFIQKKVYEMNALGNTGKFQDDFRITVYGKFIRKYWLDELPQLLNWLRGDIKVVGIRAMSFHYFSLYPEWYQQLYFKTRPGFISPLFDEKTASFEDIVEVEGNYLKAYQSGSLAADIKYFGLTFRQILEGVRSK